MSAAPNCGRPHQASGIERSAHLIGDDSDDSGPLPPGWMARRWWWYCVGMAWGAALTYLGIRLGILAGRG